MNSDHGLGPGASGLGGGSGGMAAAQRTSECSWAGAGNQSVDSFYGEKKKKKKKTKVCMFISCACAYSGWCVCAYDGVVHMSRKRAVRTESLLVHRKCHLCKSVCCVQAIAVSSESDSDSESADDSDEDSSSEEDEETRKAREKEERRQARCCLRAASAESCADGRF